VLKRGGQQDAAGFSAKGRGADEAEQHFGAAFANEDLA
jgi:hypothetical protein